jgi:2-keto-4-pentenoate hydratase
MIGVEAEVAFRLAKDLPPRSRPYSERSVAAAIGEVVVAIELCDTRLANWKDTSGLWKLADFQNNSALVVGSGTKDWLKIDFLKQEMENPHRRARFQSEGRAIPSATRSACCPGW